MALTKDIDAWLRSDAGQETTRPRPELKDDLSAPFQYRILVVDDEEKVLLKSSTVLIREGYDVRTARDGFDALAVLRESVPDLLISDLRMPNMSGFELLKRGAQEIPRCSGDRVQSRVCAGYGSDCSLRPIHRKRTEVAQQIGRVCSRSVIAIAAACSTSQGQYISRLDTSASPRIFPADMPELYALVSSDDAERGNRRRCVC